MSSRSGRDLDRNECSGERDHAEHCQVKDDELLGAGASVRSLFRLPTFC